MVLVSSLPPSTSGFKIHQSVMGIFSDVLCLVLTAVPPANFLK